MMFGRPYPLDMERKLKVHKTFRRHPGTSPKRLMNVQFMFCILGEHLHLKLKKFEDCLQVISCKIDCKVAFNIACKIVFSTNKYH